VVDVVVEVDVDVAVIVVVVVDDVVVVEAASLASGETKDLLYSSRSLKA